MAEENKEMAKLEEIRQKEIKEKDQPAVPVNKEKISKKEKKAFSSSLSIKSPEKIITIPMRNALRKSSRRRRNYAVNLVRDYLKQHTKTGNVKLGKFLNEELSRAPRKIKISFIKDEGTIKAELFGHVYTDFTAQKKEEKARGLMDRVRQRMTPKEAQKQAIEDRIEGKKEVKEEAKKTMEKADAAPEGK